MTALLKVKGILYLSVPIGKEIIEFNAHRVFSIDSILKMTKSDYHLKGFSYVDDAGNLHADVNVKDIDLAGNFGCEYGCGIFELIKKY
jgi:hypothetical protein